MPGLLGNILTFPYAPVRILGPLARLVQREVNREMYDSANVRRQLEELDEAHEWGEISDEEYEQAQEAAISRLVPQTDAAAEGGSS
jgi:cytochrome c-type biogenesis protein CcmH/NrfG